MGGVLLMLAGLLGAQSIGTQPNDVFDVASVKQNKSSDGEASANVPLGPGNVYAPTGGTFNAKGFPLLAYVKFAYRMNDAQIAAFQKQSPEWVKSDRFDIQARTDKTEVTKDELRIMMRALLAERFGLVVHFEKRELPVYRLRLVRPGELGSGLRIHPATLQCSAMGNELRAEWPEARAGGFPAICGAILGLPAKGQGDYRLGGSDIPMQLLADSLTGWGGLNKPVLDGTEIVGKIDFVLEYAPLARLTSGDATDAPDAVGVTFQEALKSQLGLRLESGTGQIDLVVLDAISHPTAN